VNHVEVGNKYEIANVKIKEVVLDALGMPTKIELVIPSTVSNFSILFNIDVNSLGAFYFHFVGYDYESAATKCNTSSSAVISSKMFDEQYNKIQPEGRGYPYWVRKDHNIHCYRKYTKSNRSPGKSYRSCAQSGTPVICVRPCKSKLTD